MILYHMRFIENAPGVQETNQKTLTGVETSEDRKGKSKYVDMKRKCGLGAWWGRRPSGKAHGKGKESLPFLLWLFGGKV